MPLNNPFSGVLPKVKNETRLMTVASGDVAYTGYGFQPSALLILAENTSSGGSIGSVAPSLDEVTLYDVGDHSVQSNYSFLIALYESAVNYQTATLKSFDSDGFTLTWTKGGTPGGTTAHLIVIAFK